MPTYIDPSEVPFPSPSRASHYPPPPPNWHGHDTPPQLPIDPHTGCCPPDNGITIGEWFANDAKAEAEARAAWDGGKAAQVEALAKLEANLPDLRAKLAEAEAALKALGTVKFSAETGFEYLAEDRRHVRRRWAEAVYAVEATEAAIAHLKATKPAPFVWPRAYLVDRSTRTALFSAQEVADHLRAQAEARGYKWPALEREIKKVLR
jgi:hypothetical protein